MSDPLQQQIDNLRGWADANFRAIAGQLRNRNRSARAEESRALEAHLAPRPITSSAGHFGTAPTGMSTLNRLRHDPHLTITSGQASSLIDINGNVIVSGETDGNITGDALTEFIEYGVHNGSFSIPPFAGPGVTIVSGDPETSMPYWNGPTSVSGSAITCTWVADAASPSGHVLRFTVAAGLAGDEAYVEQIVPIGGSRARWISIQSRAALLRVVATATFRAYLNTQFLDVSGATIGSSNEKTSDLTADATLYSLFAYPNGNVVPSTARSLRIRIGVRRAGGAGISDTATIDFTDVRADRMHPRILSPDDTNPATYGSVALWQSSGVAKLAATASGNPPTGDPTLTLTTGSPDTADLSFSGSAPYLSLTGNSVHQRFQEGAAPGTPASGYHAVYAKSSDSRLYGMDDSGVERLLDYSAADVVAAASVFAFSGAFDSVTTTGAITDLAVTNARVQWNGASAATLHGVAGGTEGRIVFINNITDAQVLTIADQSATELTAGNRIRSPGAADITLQPKQGAFLIYDAVNIRWRVYGALPAAIIARDTIWDAKGDLVTGSGADTAVKTTVGADDTILMADAAASGGVKWVASASPSAVGTAAATGTADTFTRGDHVHAHEAAHINHDTTWAAVGDLIVGTANDTAAVLAFSAPAANVRNVLGSDNGDTTLAYKTALDATAPVTQAFADAAAAGTSLVFAHRDHKHGMPAAPTAASVGASANPHGAADHTDITRSTWLLAKDSLLDSGTLATLGAAPNQVQVVALADAATQGATWTWGVPADYTSGTISLKPFWVPGATDGTAHTVRWSYDVKALGVGTDVTAAGTTVNVTGASAARTINLHVTGEAITDTTVTPTANSTVMIDVRRIGADAADTYVGVVNLVAVRVDYTASQ